MFFYKGKEKCSEAAVNKESTGGTWECGVLWLFFGQIVTASHCGQGRRSPSFCWSSRGEKLLPAGDGKYLIETEW